MYLSINSVGKRYGSADGISTVVDEGVLHVVLDTPRRRNALRDDAVAVFVEALALANTDEEVRVVLISGALDITDRLKDLYMVGGFMVSPAEVEYALREHPAVADAAVVGAPDDRLGEVGHAHVVFVPGARLTADELVEWSRQRMANFKVPRVVHFAEDLPRTPSGKVVKTALRRNPAGVRGERVPVRRSRGPRGRPAGRDPDPRGGGAAGDRRVRVPGLHAEGLPRRMARFD